MSFIKNSFLARSTTASATGSGLTPEQEQQLEDLANANNIWVPCMIAHEHLTYLSGDLVMMKGN